MEFEGITFNKDIIKEQNDINYPKLDISFMIFYILFFIYKSISLKK